MRVRIWQMAAAVMALTAAITSCQSGGPRLAARHVIIISLDTTRADFFGCYGNKWIQTPRLDRLARQSILLSNYMTVVPTTLPSHATLFTGTYPHTHGTPSNGFVVNADNVMLTEILKEAGFHTAGFLGSFALDSRFEFDQGFDHYDEKFDRLFGTHGYEQDERSAESVTNAAIAYLDQLGTPRNLFLFVHYFDPHTPYQPPPPYDRLYDRTGGAGLTPIGQVRQMCGASGGREFPEATRWAQRYAGEVSYMDEHVGRLLDDLEHRGILDDALLIVASDHGENHWEHADYFDHGSAVYETTLRGVGMIRLPKGRHGGTRLDAPVASIDILPTILRFLGLPSPARVEGEALDLDAPAAPRGDRALLAEATEPWIPPGESRWANARKMRSARAGRYKLVQSPISEREALYDVAADPLEQTDLLPAATAELTATAAALRSQLAAWGAAANPLPSHFDASLRDDTMRRLKAMGYLGGDDAGPTTRGAASGPEAP
ncbi:MAG: Arylsulfatase [Phycisphaerae bacterium]|nr:Arylsulfatase [Phycisphaerae bacterium]